MKVDNSQGKIFYGMHFYPGVARYEEPDKAPYTIFLNENTIRKMDQSFAGRPVFVEHVEEVDDNINTLRAEADGWVIESFYNAADGKHWAKFIVVSDIGLSAIRRGYRLSNSYFPKSMSDGGTWNGLDYNREITDGEYEHLAIVNNPRYEESVIMTPEQFKAYNDEKQIELTRLANSKKETKKMAFNIFKRQKVDNAVDIEGMEVELPKSKKAVSLTKMITEYDAIVNMNGYANGDHMVKLNEKEEMSVNDLIKKHQTMCQEMESMKSKKEDAKSEDGGEPGKGADDEDPAMDNDALDIDQMGEVGDRGGDKHLGNPDESDKSFKSRELSNEEDEDKKKDEEKKKNARIRAAKLKNAQDSQVEDEVARIELPEDQVARGKARYGSK